MLHDGVTAVPAPQRCFLNPEAGQQVPPDSLYFEWSGSIAGCRGWGPGCELQSAAESARTYPDKACCGCLPSPPPPPPRRAVF